MDLGLGNLINNSRRYPFPTMISEYRTKLISKEILQKKLEELTEMVDEDKNSQWRWEFFKKSIYYVSTKIAGDYNEPLLFL